MTESLRDLLSRSAETAPRADLDVAAIIEQAERRLVRRRLGAVVASAAAVAAVIGGIALQADRPSTAPSPPVPATQIPEPAPELGAAIYFDALGVDGSDLTDRVLDITGPKDIYLARESGTTRRVIATKADERCPRVSPDHRSLAYLEGMTVVVRNLDATGDPGGTTVRVSPETDQGLTCPQWSPDGRRLAVGVQRYDAPDQVFEVLVIERDGTERAVGRQQARFMPLSEIAWSPDGDAIAFKTPDSIWVVPLDGGAPERLWRGRAPLDPEREGFPPYPGMPTRVTWLATGELLVSTQTEVDGDERLYAVDPGSGRAGAIGTVRSSGRPAVWSPDGSTLAFEGFEDGTWTFDRASGRTVRLQPRLDGRTVPIGGPVWSPDGQRLLATGARPGDRGGSSTFALVSMNPDGSSVEVLTPWTTALYSPADASWSPR